MIRAICKYLSLSDLPASVNVAVYCEFVRPIDYRFSLEVNAEYFVMSIIERKGTLWFFVAPSIGDFEVSVVPAALFAIDNAVIPQGMAIRMANSPQPSLEILPVSLARIGNWFEKYVDGDESVMHAVHKEVMRSRENSTISG